MTRRDMSPAQRRFLWRFVGAMSVYAVTIPFIQSALQAHPDGAWQLVLSILPTIPLLAAIATIGLYLGEETDEFLRVQYVRAIVIATGLTLAVCTVWGFLEEGGVTRHVPAWMVFPVWAVGIGIANGWCRLSDRLGGRP